MKRLVDSKRRPKFENLFKIREQEILNTKKISLTMIMKCWQRRGNKNSLQKEERSNYNYNYNYNFEKNVIRKNIEERKKMEQELGIHTLAQELKACSKTNFLSNMESMLDSDDEN